MVICVITAFILWALLFILAIIYAGVKRKNFRYSKMLALLGGLVLSGVAFGGLVEFYFWRFP